MTRRGFLKGGLAAFALPFLSHTARPSDPDVIVIGAGAAGLSATETLMRLGKSTVCIEASNRKGGRIHTDESTFGVPYDLGAHWLHNASDNPYVAYGRKNGFDVYPAADQEVHYVGDRLANASERGTFQAAYTDALSAIGRAGAAGRDVAPSSVVDATGDWAETVHHQLGAYEMGKDFDQFSCADWYSSEGGDDWFCREGFGALFAHRWRYVPVELATVARKVKWGGAGVQVETSKGTISAKACIITVSTGVLASGAIAFEPALPEAQRAAFEGITMGTYNHVALQFRDNFFGIGDDGYVIYQLENSGESSPRGVGLLVNVGGTNLTLADVGGAFGKGLEAEGQQAAVDFALAELTSIFGSKVRGALITSHATAWGRNRFVLGSYASAEPGAYPRREDLRAPVGGKIVFAGEATSKTEWATVAGADKEGRRVAKLVASRV
jgi:monoamine oxidase